MNAQKKMKLYKSIRILSIILFVGCAGFLIYYLGIQPYHSRQVNQKYRDLYHSAENLELSPDDSETITDAAKKEPVTKKNSIKLDRSYKNGATDKDGILLKFSKLLEYNSDIKGWLNIPGTNIDYPVMQDYNKGDFYLSHDFEGKTDKNGCLYIDGHSDVKKPTKNIVIHGHNMDSTGMMFHELPKYKDINFYKQHPVITFDSIYQNASWKIIAFIRVSGINANNGTFNYMQSVFDDDNAFLDFLYQIEMRSLYQCPVDVNEKDSLLMLSTCTYEVHNYRTVVVARKVRKGESKTVDTASAKLRENVLYPNSWYQRYGGEPPVATNFKDAMALNEIDWYDGKTKVKTAIGQIVKHDNALYQITSGTTLKYMGYNNRNVKDLTIPSTVKLGDRTYDVSEISADAFTYAEKLKTLKIGNKIEIIPAKTFENCKKLESVIIGDAVKEIGKKAFYQLENLKKVKIRSSELTVIGEKAFKGIYDKAKFKLPKKQAKNYTKLLEKSSVSKDSKFTKY